MAHISRFPVRMAGMGGIVGSVAIPSGRMERLTARLARDGVLQVPAEPFPDAGTVARELVEAACYVDEPPASARLPFPYHSLPAPVRMAIASAIGRFQKRRMGAWANFPAWPLDLSVDFWLDCAHPREAGDAVSRSFDA